MAGSGRCAAPRSAFAGFRFPAEVIVVAVRWYLRYGLSYRDVEELLVERGIEVDHVTVYRWVQRFTPLLADAARFTRHAPGDRWFVDETYVKVNGAWRYVYRAVDQHGQVIDVLLSAHRDAKAARRFFARAVRTLKVTPSDVVTTNWAWTYHPPRGWPRRSPNSPMRSDRRRAGGRSACSPIPQRNRPAPTAVAWCLAYCCSAEPKAACTKMTPRCWPPMDTPHWRWPTTGCPVYPPPCRILRWSTSKRPLPSCSATRTCAATGSRSWAPPRAVRPRCWSRRPSRR